MFKPVDINGKSLKLAWQFYFFKINFCWPLEENASRIKIYGREFIHLVSLCCISLAVSGEIIFVFYNHDDVTLVAECACLQIIGSAYFIKMLYHFIRTKSLRKLFDEFFKTIYIASGTHPQAEKIVRRTFLPAVLLTYSYTLPPTFVILAPIGKFLINPFVEEKPLLYPMVSFYDVQEPMNYGFTIIATFWAGTSCVGLMIAENYIMNIMLCHCAARYEIVRSDLDNLCSNNALKLIANKKVSSHVGKQIHKDFTKRLYEVIKKHQHLDKFAKQLDTYFGFTFFMVMSVGTFLMCIMAFQIASYDSNEILIKYIVWIISTATEIIVLGYSGQQLTNASEELRNGYYMTNWEQLLNFADSKTNAALMKDLSFAIQRSQKPVEMSGLQFVTLSLISTEKAISTSVSYFMFLTAMQARS